jgi:uncharacterized protein YjdB
MPQLLALDRNGMHALWDSVWGDRSTTGCAARHRRRRRAVDDGIQKSLGHSHVLAPEHRTPKAPGPSRTSCCTRPPCACAWKNFYAGSMSVTIRYALTREQAARAEKVEEALQRHQHDSGWGMEARFRPARTRSRCSKPARHLGSSGPRAPSSARPFFVGVTCTTSSPRVRRAAGSLFGDPDNRASSPPPWTSSTSSTATPRCTSPACSPPATPPHPHRLHPDPGPVRRRLHVGNPTGLDSIQVSPATQSLSVGQTAQFTATGTYGNSNHSSTQNITGSVTWSSSTPSVAIVSASGLVTAVGAGSTTITASAAAFNGPTSSSGVLTVTSSGGGTAGGTVTSISVIPNSQSVSAPGQTSQFIAIGTTSSGATENLTGLVTWTSSSTQIASIGATTGLATAIGQGTTTITAIYNSSGTVVTGTATFTVSGGTSEKYTAVSILPGSQAVGSGQTGQFIALGTLGSTGLETDVTSSSQIKWFSSIPSVATVSASGLATGLSAGTTTITAELINADNTVVTNTATVAVSIAAAPEPLVSLTIVPDTITVGNLQDTGQFLAIGTFSTAPYVRDLTNSVVWLTSAPNVFPVSTNSNGSQGQENAGIATAFGNGGATIIAEATAADGSIQTATATFNCPLTLPNPNGDPPTPGTCFPGSQASALLSTLTVYNEGLNTTGWLVTAPSASGTPAVLHCGPGSTSGGSVCTATYPVGSTVVLTAPAETGVNFGGWSQNCASTNPAPRSPGRPYPESAHSPPRSPLPYPPRSKQTAPSAA